MKDWIEDLAGLGILLSAAQIKQFEAYLQLLLEWNARMNLTAVRQPDAIRWRHFYDSLTCATVMENVNGRHLIDVGTGAGFPGLPLKILFPELQVTLVESVAKKGRFLEAVVATLGLSQVHIESERAESLGQNGRYREQFDWAVARAVAEMRILAELLLPFCRVGGVMLAQKGENAETELAAAGNAIQVLGGGEPVIKEVMAPEKEAHHYLVLVEKIGKTPQNYPRRIGVPAKRPL